MGNSQEVPTSNTSTLTRYSANKRLKHTHNSEPITKRIYDKPSHQCLIGGAAAAVGSAMA